MRAGVRNPHAGMNGSPNGLRACGRQTESGEDAGSGTERKVGRP